MFNSCLEKQQQVIEIFKDCTDPGSRYQKIIELGRNLPPLAEEYKTNDHRVQGCQSVVYLRSYLNPEDRVVFEVESDALISAGLAVLLIKVYSGETPEAILQCPPNFFEELGLNTSLTPSRVNGLHSIHLRMKQEALQLLSLLSNIEL